MLPISFQSYHYLTSKYGYLINLLLSIGSFHLQLRLLSIGLNVWLQTLSATQLRLDVLCLLLDVQFETVDETL